jgi:hypothetical protein
MSCVANGLEMEAAAKPARRARRLTRDDNDLGQFMPIYVMEVAIR